MHEQSSTQRDVSRCTDHELVVKLRQLVAADRALSVELLMHMGEMDARGLYREQAYASMFDYSVQALHMSDAEAYLRIHAARMGRKFPLILDLFASGALHLTGIKLLGPYLTPDNHVQLLERARGKSKREVERLVAEIAPKPDVPNQLRKLPQRRALQITEMARVASRVQPDHADGTTTASLTRTPVCSTPSPESSSPAPESAAPHETSALHALSGLALRAAAAISADPSPSPSSAASLPFAADRHKAAFALQSPRSQASCAPLSPGRYKLQLSVEQGLHDKLEQLQQLLRHRVPDGNLAPIVELAVDLLLDKTLKKRFGQGAAAKTSPRARSAASDDKRSDSSRTEEPSLAEKPVGLPQAQRPCAGARELTAEDHPPHSHPAPLVQLVPGPEQHADPLRAADTRVDPVSAADTRVDPAGAPPAPRAREPRSMSRYIPRSVRREVYRVMVGSARSSARTVGAVPRATGSKSIITALRTRSAARPPRTICASCAAFTTRCTPSASSAAASCLASCSKCAQSGRRLHASRRTHARCNSCRSRMERPPARDAIPIIALAARTGGAGHRSIPAPEPLRTRRDGTRFAFGTTQRGARQRAAAPQAFSRHRAAARPTRWSESCGRAH